MLGHILYSSFNRGTSFVQESTQNTYVLMNNQALLRTSYPDLSTYWPIGSFGSTSGVMVIPDVQDVVFRGVDAGRGADENRINRTSVSGILPSGTTIGSYQVADMPSHVHISGTFASGEPGCPFGAATQNNWGGSQRLTPIGGDFLAMASTSELFFHPDNYEGIVQSGTATTDFNVGGVTMYPYICVAVGG